MACLFILFLKITYFFMTIRLSITNLIFVGGLKIEKRIILSVFI